MIMAFDQNIRNKLQRYVGEARDLLTEEFTRQVQKDYGMDPNNGEISPLDKLTHLDDARQETARLLRKTLDHYLVSTPSGNVMEVLHRIIREQAFTVLNRLCAVRMAEARGIIMESIGNGYHSKGFQLYNHLAKTSMGEIGDSYRCYLFSVFDEFAMDLPVLFDRYSPLGRLFPKPEKLISGSQANPGLIEMMNSPEIAPLWAEDETIGWIYQYFNSVEERRQMRDESPTAPRNSRELAVRNQFFTPRYVVEFLTDNTLGRIWYEMTQGETSLKDVCRYLVRRPNEIFLKPGEEASKQEQATEDLSQEELLKQPVYISFRPLKDPREILMLDPACGSMHFGLYAFDLFEKIYEEAWELEGKLGNDILMRAKDLKSFQETYPTKEAFLCDIPRLIIEHNIHGIDIDPRAVQISGLSLWLRAQRSWKERDIKPTDRPQIRKSNIICAEPMPGEKRFLDEFIETHLSTSPEDKLLGQLVRRVFDAMQLAGEAGSLLKIEEEISDAVAEAKRKWGAGPKYEQPGLFEDDRVKPDQQQLDIDTSGITNETFWERAEGRIYTALQTYAEQTENGEGYQRHLFADDAARGFAFIDLCRKRYDVVLMNPPFGGPSASVMQYMLHNYEAFNSNLLCGFIVRAFKLGVSQVIIGVIYDRTAIVKSTYEDFRRTHVLQGNRLVTHADLGWGVLDANVEVTSSVFQLGTCQDQTCVFADVRNVEPGSKGIELLRILKTAANEDTDSLTIFAQGEIFLSYPNAVVGYDFPSFARRAFKMFPTLMEAGVTLFEGHTIKSKVFFRYWWEIPSTNTFFPGAKWQRLYNGGDYQRYVSPLCDVVLYGNTGDLIALHPSTVLRNLSYQQRGKIGFGKRGEYVDAHVVPDGFVSTVEGKHVICQESIDPYTLLALLNSKLFQTIINLYCGQHKYPGYVEIFPCPDLRSNLHLLEASVICKKIFNERDRIENTEEISPKFGGKGIICIWESDILFKIKDSNSIVSQLEEQLNECVFRAYGLNDIEKNQVNNRCKDEPSIGGWSDGVTLTQIIELRCSFLVGTVFGRWDIRFVTGEKSLLPLPGSFELLPTCPPGQLQNEQGLPITEEEVGRLKEEGSWNYPIEITWEGILVDDQGHPLDIEGQIHQVLQVIYKEDSETSEQEICNILDVDTLRDYFRQPTGFFANHLKRYRQAPLYWPLSTASGSYALWIYYHRLTDQTLYTCVNDFVEPKLRQVAETVSELRGKNTRNKLEEKELERLSDLEMELKDFRDELLRIAKFWKPNLNDGVQITAAPLWKLFKLPKWQKTLKETWRKFEKGEYDEVHLAYSIWPERVIRKAHKDRSMAIAHDLEEELWEEIVVGSDRYGNPKTKWVPKELSEKQMKMFIQRKTGITSL